MDSGSGSGSGDGGNGAFLQCCVSPHLAWTPRNLLRPLNVAPTTTSASTKLVFVFDVLTRRVPIFCMLPWSFVCIFMRLTTNRLPPATVSQISCFTEEKNASLASQLVIKNKINCNFLWIIVLCVVIGFSVCLWYYFFSSFLITIKIPMKL